MADDDKKDTEQHPDAPPLSPKMKAFAEHLNKPVAVQLKVPLVGVDATIDRDPNTGELPINDRGEKVVRFVVTAGLGWPTEAPVRDKDGKVVLDEQGRSGPKAEVLLFGALRAAPCGTRLVLLRKSDLGARGAHLIAPDYVDYITTIVEVPPPEAIAGSGLISSP